MKCFVCFFWVYLKLTGNQINSNTVNSNNNSNDNEYNDNNNSNKGNNNTDDSNPPTPSHESFGGMQNCNQLRID